MRFFIIICMSNTFQFYCPSCGTPNSSVNGSKPKFCGECGYNFAENKIFSPQSTQKQKARGATKSHSQTDDDFDFEEDQEFFDQASFGSREDFISSIKLQIPKREKRTIGDLAKEEKTGSSRPIGRWMNSTASDKDVQAAIKKACTTTNRVEI